MTDPSSREPHFDETPPSTTRQVAASDWTRAEIEPQPEPPPPRERLFSRKVLIGWALVALAIYFGVGVIRTVIRESIKSSISAVSEQIPREKTTIYRTPNGKITISRSKNGSITISRDQPDVPPPAPAAATVPAAGTPDPAGAPKAGAPTATPRIPPPPPAKR